MFHGVEHTAIASPDPAALAAWYRDALEFRIVHLADGNYFVRGRNGSLLEIIAAQGRLQPPQRTDAGIRHLAIDVEDFDAALAALQGRGVSLLSEPSTGPGNRIVFFRDPDGNILHLIQRGTPLP